MTVPPIAQELGLERLCTVWKELREVQDQYGLGHYAEDVRQIMVQIVDLQAKMTEESRELQKEATV